MRRHFQNLLGRYSAPLIVVNLMMQRASGTGALHGAEDGAGALGGGGVGAASDTDPTVLMPSAGSGEPAAEGRDEAALSAALEEAVAGLQAETRGESDAAEILYVKLDMKRAAKQSAAGAAHNLPNAQQQSASAEANNGTAADGRFYAIVLHTAECLVRRTGLHHLKGPQVLSAQTGVARVNCVDCLDRTHVLSYLQALAALQRQLRALGLLPSGASEGLSAAAGDALAALHEEAGDVLALQYAGSVAHKKYLSGAGQVQEQRPYTRATKELLTSVQRHDNNSFHDQEKQLGVNLLLGVWRPWIKT